MNIQDIGKNSAGHIGYSDLWSWKVKLNIQIRPSSLVMIGSPCWRTLAAPMEWWYIFVLVSWLLLSSHTFFSLWTDWAEFKFYCSLQDLPQNWNSSPPPFLVDWLPVWLAVVDLLCSSTRQKDFSHLLLYHTENKVLSRFSLLKQPAEWGKSNRFQLLTHWILKKGELLERLSWKFDC